MVNMWALEWIMVYNDDSVHTPVTSVDQAIQTGSCLPEAHLPNVGLPVQRTTQCMATIARTEGTLDIERAVSPGGVVAAQDGGGLGAGDEGRVKDVQTRVGAVDQQLIS